MNGIDRSALIALAIMKGADPTIQHPIDDHASEYNELERCWKRMAADYVDVPDLTLKVNDALQNYNKWFNTLSDEDQVTITLA